MDDNTNKSVVSLNTHKAHSQSRVEVDGIRRCISMLSWDIQVQQVLALCGLSSSEALLLESVKPTSGSHAQKLGHESIESLISKNEDSDGLGLHWPEFQEKIKAFVFRQKFSISDSSFAEINKLVADATIVVGRTPVDAAEFHGAMQKAMQESIDTVRKESQARIDTLQEKQRELISNLSKTSDQLKGAKETNQALMLESANRIQAVTRETAMKIDAIEKTADEKIQALRADFEKEFSVKLETAKADLNKQITEAGVVKSQLESEIGRFHSRVATGDLVEKSVLDSLNVQMEHVKASETAMRDQMIALNTQLVEAEKEKALIQETGNLNQEKVANLTAQTEVLEMRMREMVEDRMGSSEFAVLQERVAIRQIEIDSLRLTTRSQMMKIAKTDRELGEMKGRYKQLRSQAQGFAARMNSRISAQQASYQMVMKQNSHLKMAIVGLATSTVCMGSLALVKIIF